MTVRSAGTWKMLCTGERTGENNMFQQLSDWIQLKKDCRVHVIVIWVPQAASKQPVVDLKGQ